MPEPRYQTGDLVRFQVATRWIKGRVKEDRGPIGLNGRRLYLIEYRADSQSDASSFVELPATQLEPIDRSVSAEY